MNKIFLYIIFFLASMAFIKAALPPSNSNGEIIDTQRVICETNKKTGSVTMKSSIIADYVNSQGQTGRISCPPSMCKGKDNKPDKGDKFIQQENLKDLKGKGNVPGDQIMRKGGKPVCQNKSGKKGIPITDTEEKPMKYAQKTKADPDNPSAGDKALDTIEKKGKGKPSWYPFNSLKDQEESFGTIPEGRRQDFCKTRSGKTSYSTQCNPATS